MKKLRKAVALFVAFAMLFVTLPGTVMVSAETAASDCTVSLSPSVESIEAGSTFAVAVKVSSASSDAEEVAALQAKITYDTSKIQYLSTAAPSGSGLDADASDAEGTLNLNVYGDSQTVSSDGITMAELTFRTRGDVSGEASFAISDTPVVGLQGNPNDIPAKAGDTVDIRISVPKLVLTIRTEEDLREFAASVNAGMDYTDQMVTLENDINLTGSWTPAGTWTNPFTGTFEGGDHTIDGLLMNLTKEDESLIPAGLFGYIKNVTIRNLTVSGNISCENMSGWTYVGGIAGYAETGTVSHCTSKVNVSMDRLHGYMGGIVGQIAGTTANRSSVTDCMNYGKLEVTEFIEGNGYAGGIAGEAMLTDISRCGNYGSVTTAVPMTHNNSTVAGVSGDYYYSQGHQGGVLGGVNPSMYGNAPVTVQSCFNAGTISGAGKQMGGIAGLCLSIRDCYNISDITGNTTDNVGNGPVLGGIVGQGAQPVNCYSIGSVTSTADKQKADLIMGISRTDEQVSNCYTKEDTFTAEDLGSAFKPDTNNINQGYPLLEWQTDAVSDETFPVTFEITPSDASVTVYSDTAMTEAIDKDSDGYELRAGTYFYRIEADGYVAETGSFTVSIEAVKIEKKLQEASKVTFAVTPADAALSVLNGTVTMESDSHSEGVYAYTLYSGTRYSYTAAASGYTSVTRSFVAKNGDTIAVTLTESLYDENAPEDRYIYGDENEGKTSTISKGGTYYIGDGATGIMTIDTTEPVTLVGKGISDPAVYGDLFLDCRQAGTNLTLQDVGISNEENAANLISFSGKENILNIEGECLLDYDFGYTDSHDALIHVPYDGSLTIRGAGTLYQYNCTQGAGIGGDTGEMNGDITFAMTGSAFIKGTKQGAVIGAGANAKSSGEAPGSVTFESGTYNLVSNSRGAVIGGSAGSGGASSGTEVYVRGGNININCDFTGAAVGGGGYDAGNDASGGTVYITGGSLRTYIDRNAATNERGGFNNAAFTEGINDAIITAQRLNESGEKVYKCVFDTSELGEGPYTILVDGKEFYTGGRHEYAFVNESLSKNEGTQIAVTRTQDNWIPNDESNLYFYLTGTDHTITVGDRTYRATFDDSLFEHKKDEEGNDVVVADQKVYTSGAFTIGAEAEPTFKTHSLVLSGQIGVKFFMDLPDIEGVDYRDSTMEFTVCGKTQTAAFDGNEKNSTGKYYGFTCYVNSVQMADDITAVFHYGDGQTVEETYSVAQYVDKFEEIIASTPNAFTENEKILIEALADYGHYIQPFLAKSRNWKIGVDHQEMTGIHELTNKDVEAAADAVKDCGIARETGDSGIEKVTFSLYLDSDTALYFYLKPKAEFSGDVNALVDGTSGNAAEKQKDGRYRVAVPGVSAHRLGTPSTIRVSAGEDFTITASAMSYVKLLMESAAYRDDNDARLAMTSLYNYYAAADALQKAQS